ncbi:MAG: DUF333 domain-containing protein [Azospirillum brasilense]|nr:MAG: DUF333 domain-containing protein [Azospirillum brasilense]
MRYRGWTPLAALALALLAGCGGAQGSDRTSGEAGQGETRSTAGPVAGMPNPASVFCRDQGGTTQFQKQADGGVIGLCRFPDGRVCEEWSFFRSKTCLPPRQPG